MANLCTCAINNFFSNLNFCVVTWLFWLLLHRLIAQLSFQHKYKKTKFKSKKILHKKKLFRNPQDFFHKQLYCQLFCFNCLKDSVVCKCLRILPLQQWYLKIYNAYYYCEQHTILKKTLPNKMKQQTLTRTGETQ